MNENNPYASIVIRAEIRREYTAPGRADEKFSIALQADATVPFQQGTQDGLKPMALTVNDLRTILEGQVEAHVRDVKGDVLLERSKAAFRKQVDHYASQAFGMQSLPVTPESRALADQVGRGLADARAAYDALPAPRIFPPLPALPDAE